MFKSLKKNITEVVKDSPQPIGGLRNSQSFDDNVLSIGKDDANTTANTAQGFSSLTPKPLTEGNRSRRLCHSPIDCLFSPQYEASSMSHLQSDLDISASEIEEEISKIDGVERLIQKCKCLENELVKVRSYKIELENSKQNEEALQKQIQELQRLYPNLFVENEGLLCSVEPKLSDKLQQDSLEKEEQHTNQYTWKLNKPSSSNLNYINVQILEKNKLLQKHAEVSTITELSEKSESYNKLEKNHVEKYIKLGNTITNLENDKIFVESCEDKIPQLDDHIKTLQGEVEHVKYIAQNKEEENVYLSNENMNLERVMTNMNGKLRILEEKYEAVGMNSTENKLLLLKLQKLEEEKNNMLIEFEMERKMFNDMLEDHNELRKKESYLELLKKELKDCGNKVIQLKKYLAEEKEHNVKLDDKKLQLEREIDDLMRKIRIFEQKDETKHMNKTECGILEMKLKKLVIQNQELSLEFEQEREVYERDMQALQQEITIPEQNQDLTNRKHSLLDIQKLNAKKEQEIVYLMGENAKLQQTDIELCRKLKLLQGKYEAVHVNNNECRLLELKLKKEEERNDRLRVEFEMERKILSDLLENHKEIHEKNRFIEKLEHKLRELHIEKKDLKHSLKNEEQKNIQLEHKRTALEHEIVKMGEHNKILEEKDEVLHMDRTEYKLLKIKLRKSEMENKNLQEIFEQERIVFDKVFKEKSVQEKEVKHLLNEIRDKKNFIKKEEEMINVLRTKLNHEIKSMND